MLTKGVPYDVKREVDILRHRTGVAHGGAGNGQPRLDTDIHMADAILHLSGTTNGHLATHGFKNVEKRTGTQLHDLAAEHEGKQITFADTQVAPVLVITSPEWSGSESGGRRYSPFTINIERKKPSPHAHRAPAVLPRPRLDPRHGEALPVYRPPLNMTELFGEAALGEQKRPRRPGALPDPAQQVVDPQRVPGQPVHAQPLLRRADDLLSDVDAEKIGVADNDRIEAVNRNGVVAARAIVSHRMAEGHRLHAPRAGPAHRRPLTETNGRRGGIHNSLTRIMMKPSHMRC